MANFITNAQVFKHTLKGVVLALFFTASLTSCFAQKTESKKALNYFHEATRAKQFGRINEAIVLLDKAIKADENFIDAHMFKGDLLLFDRKYEAAKSALLMAIAVDSTYSWAYLSLAKAYEGLGDMEGAKSTYAKILTLPNLSGLAKKQADKGLSRSTFAADAMKHPVPFDPKNMGSAINSEFDEYFPALTGDDQTILFTRRVNNNEDFYTSIKLNGKWILARNLGRPINSQMNEGAPTLSANGQLLIYTACEQFGSYGKGKTGYGRCDLFGTQKQGAVWSRPVNLGPQINTVNWESQPSFSADGKTLFFVRGDNKTGNHDIFMSVYETGKGWSLAEKLSGVINTDGVEQSVMIHPDGKTLYFSSDGHPGMGGLDLFMSRKDKDGNWTKPINLGYPINTTGDENSLMVSASGDVAFFSSDRPGGYGRMDLYQFDLPDNVKPEPVTYIKGTVQDFYTKQPVDAKFELIDLETGEVIINSTSSPANGEFLVCLPSNKEYALNVSKNGYLFHSENFELKKQENLKPYEKNIHLRPIKVGEKVVLKNIFFDSGKFELKDKSKAELTKLIKFLELNPTTKVEIGGHTDNVGSDAANQLLSENRAKAVYNYLISNKVAPIRLSYKGYGETQPIAENETPEGRAENRRTEFKIIE
jgi:outer membrane protein OmpA-like peptidoglycan-associated protein/Tol biopolymer transport system component